jgi:hypothetical protein
VPGAYQLLEPRGWKNVDPIKKRKRSIKIKKE